MKRITKVTITTLVLLLLAMAASASEERQPKVITDPGQLHGAWKVLHIPGEGGPPPFQMLMVFTRDGGVVETDAGPPNPLHFSPGIGEWKKNGDSFVASYTQLQYALDETQIGTFNALLDVKLSDDRTTFSGTVRVRFFDLDDTLLFEAYGTVEGKRLPVE